MNRAIYEVWVRDPDTNLRKVLIDDWKELRYSPKLNNYAGCSISLHQSSSHLSEIAYRDRLEIIRRVTNPLNGIETKQTFGHVILAKERVLDQGGVPSEYITLNGLSYISYLASRVILPPSATDSSGAITMTATAEDATFATSSSITLYSGDMVTPTSPSSQARVVKFTVTGTSFSTTEPFTANVTTQAFTITRAQSRKADTADDVMKAYVRDCLTAATDTTRNISFFTVASDLNQADSIEWSSRYQNLLSELREITNAAGVDFDVESQSDGTLQFKTYYPQLGLDRRETNTDGNAPVIFAVERDNIAEQRWFKSGLQMVGQGANFIYVGGQGNGGQRLIVNRQNPASIVEWSRWEKFVDARDAQDSNQLSDRADSKITEMSGIDTGVSFRALASNSSIWGIHYNLGDLVTVKIWQEGIKFNDQITTIEVWVDDAGNEIVRPIVGSEIPRFDRRFNRLKRNDERLGVID